MGALVSDDARARDLGLFRGVLGSRVAASACELLLLRIEGSS